MDSKTYWSDGKSGDDIENASIINSDSVIYNLHEDTLCMREEIEQLKSYVEDLEAAIELLEDDLDSYR